MKALAVVSLCFMITLASAYPLDSFTLKKNGDYKSPRLSATPFLDCGSKASIALFQANNCTSKTCDVYQNKNITILINFTPDVDVTSLKLKATAYLGIVPVNFPLANDDGCKGQGLVCPIKKGSGAKFAGAILVPGAAPVGITVKVKWQMTDQDNNDQVCAEIAAKVAG